MEYICFSIIGRKLVEIVGPVGILIKTIAFPALSSLSNGLQEKAGSDMPMNKKMKNDFNSAFFCILLYITSILV